VIDKLQIVRITPESLEKILEGDIEEENYTCIIKFYSQHCPLCVKLAPVYKQVVERNPEDNRYYFVFNVNDVGPSLDDIIKINGVPSFAMIRSENGKRKPAVTVMEDPDDPDEETWYTVRDIEKFINKKNKELKYVK
jgi:thiol-disulfide isomerase/thioredoxin